MLKFVLLDVKENISKKGSKFYQAIVIDDMYNTTRIFITEDKAKDIMALKGKDITDKITFIYKKEHNNEFYQLYI